MQRVSGRSGEATCVPAGHHISRDTPASGPVTVRRGSTGNHPLHDCVSMRSPANIRPHLCTLPQAPHGSDGRREASTLLPFGCLFIVEAAARILAKVPSAARMHECVGSSCNWSAAAGWQASLLTDSGLDCATPVSRRRGRIELRGSGRCIHQAPPAFWSSAQPCQNRAVYVRSIAAVESDRDAIRAVLCSVAYL